MRFTSDHGNCQSYFQPFATATCCNCAGEWSREGGTSVGVGALRYRICEDCISQGQLSRFVASRNRKKISSPIHIDDITAQILVLSE